MIFVEIWKLDVLLSHLDDIIPKNRILISNCCVGDGKEKDAEMWLESMWQNSQLTTWKEIVGKCKRPKYLLNLYHVPDIL